MHSAEGNIGMGFVRLGTFLADTLDLPYRLLAL